MSVLYWRVFVPTMSGSFCSMCASTRAFSYIWIFHAFSRVQITLSGAFSGKSSVHSVIYSQEFRTTNNLESTHIKCVHMNVHTLLNAQLARCALSSSWSRALFPLFISSRASHLFMILIYSVMPSVHISKIMTDFVVLVYFSFTTRKFGFLYSLLDASTMVRSVLWTVEVFKLKTSSEQN